MDITLKEIKCLIKIVDSKSFSAAATELSLSQPTISNHIANLEKKLNTTLLKRKRDGVTPTEAGTIIYQKGRDIGGKIDSIKRNISDLNGLKTGKIKIGGSTIPGTYILPEKIGDFARIYPEINLNLVIGDTDSILLALKKYELDIGFVGYPPGSTFYKKQICMDTITVAVAKDHPWASKKYISANTLLSEPLIMREPGSATRKVFLEQVHTKIDRPLKFKFTVETSAAMKEAIKAGIGAGVISQLALKEEIKNKSIVPVKIKGLTLKRPFYLALAKAHTRSPALNEFIKLF